MWTHNFFLIFSMMTGNGAEAASAPAAMTALESSSLQSLGFAAMASAPDATSLVKPRVQPAPRKPMTIAARAPEPIVPTLAALAPEPIVPTLAALASEPIVPTLAAVSPEPIVALPTRALAAAPQDPALAPMALAKMHAQVALAPDANAVIGKVQDFYNKTKSFSAVFTQTVTNQTFNKLKPKVSKGKVYILKPGKMRWDYKNVSYKNPGDPKVSKSFISDGTHLWAVMHKNKQYYQEALDGSTLPVAVSFLMGTGDLRKEFDVAFDTPGKFGSKSDILLVLTPKQPSARYKKLWLVVDSANHAVKQSIVLNSKGDTNAIRFAGAKVNDSSLKNGHFIFNPKANKGFRLVTPPKPAKKR